MGESTIDAVVGVTLVDYNGVIRHFHAPDPDVKVRGCWGESACVLFVSGLVDAHGLVYHGESTQQNR